MASAMDDPRCWFTVKFAEDTLAVLRAALNPDNALHSGCRVLKHPGACALCVANNDCARLPMHVNCVVGSTRVSGSSTVVSAQESLRLSLDPSSGGAGLGGDSRVPSASAVAVAERDVGRSDFRAVMVREYVGDVVTIRTASGQELTGTPNHPVATRGGWVGLAELQVGDHVLRSTRPEWVLHSIDPDENDIPPTIEQVAQTFPMASDPMPTSTQEFHGDGAGSEVHVVRTDGFLGCDVEALCLKHFPEPDLSNRDVAPKPMFAGTGAGLQLGHGSFPPTHRGVSGVGQPGAFLGTGLGHAHVHGLAPTSNVESGDLGESLSDPVPGDAEGFCESLLAFSVDVAADEIVDINRRGFAGHVYNLETIDGWYLAGSIVTHNCRCRAAPYLTSLVE